MISLSHPGYWTGLVWCSLMVLCVTLAQAQPRDPIGHVVALEGVVVVRHTDSTQAERLLMQSPVYQGDLLQTLAASKAKFVLLDGMELTIGPQSALRLTDHVYKPQQQTQTTVLKAFFGIFRFVAKSMLPRGSVEVHTSNAVVAIRGTDWMAQVGPGATAAVVLEGTVAVTHARPDIQGETVLTAGMGTDVRDDQPPTPAKKWGAARVNALLQAVTLP